MATTLVLDTNIVLDLFVFADPAAALIRDGLEQQALHWLATPAMRQELQRVLGYGQIASRLAARQLDPRQVMERFDRHARVVAVPGKAPYTCKDRDDQKFIDLAVAHGALLLSKDAAVLAMARRLARLRVGVAQALPALAYSPCAC